MIAIATLCVCCAILALLLVYPAYARLMAGIMARQLEEKAPRGDKNYGGWIDE